MSGRYVEATGALVPGDKCRVRLTLNAPYTDENIQGVEDTWRSMAGVAGNVRTDQVLVHFPKGGRWIVDVDYTVTRGFSLDEIGTFCQDVIANVISSAALVGTQVLKWVTDSVVAVGEGVGKAVAPVVSALNPGLLVLAVVGIFLLTRRA